MTDLIPRWAIECAYKGGWHASTHHQVAAHVFCQAHYALDPLFWQALGKKFEWWREKAEYRLNYKDEQWAMYAHRFYDLILTGGDREKFWESLKPAS